MLKASKKLLYLKLSEHAREKSLLLEISYMCVFAFYEKIYLPLYIYINSLNKQKILFNVASTFIILENGLGFYELNTLI